MFLIINAQFVVYVFQLYDIDVHIEELREMVVKKCRLV